MRLTREQVQHVATLARLHLEDAEVERFGEQLSSVLGYVELLLGLDVEGVPPTFHVFDMAAPLRPDEPARTLTAQEALRNAPAHSGTSFLVPKVLDT